MKLGLDEKKVFITGSSRGIGLATAEAFLKEGASVIINSRNEETLKEYVQSKQGKYDGNISYVTADLTSSFGANKACEFIDKKFGKLDVFVANLGSGKPECSNPIEVSEIKRFYEINVLANTKILDILHPYLKKGNNSSVIFISSIVAREAMQAPCGYSAAKASVLALSKYLSRLWAKDGIRVNSVLPGNIFFEGGRWEELVNADRDGVMEYIKTEVPLGRFGRPEEIADAIVFLSSERAGFITGSQLVIDGGQLKSI